MPISSKSSALNTAHRNAAWVSTHVYRADCIQSATSNNWSYFLMFSGTVLPTYCLFFELRHGEIKLKGQLFSFQHTCRWNLVVSLQMCTTSNLCEKEESRSILLTLHKRSIRKILVWVLGCQSAGKKISSVTTKEKKKCDQCLYGFYKSMLW